MKLKKENLLPIGCQNGGDNQYGPHLAEADVNFICETVLKVRPLKCHHIALLTNAFGEKLKRQAAAGCGSAIKIGKGMEASVAKGVRIISLFIALPMKCL